MAYELTSNVYVNDKWYGPDYPKNGEPPAGAVTNPAAFADLGEDGQPLRDEDGNPTVDGQPVVLDQPEEPALRGRASSESESRGKR